MAPETVPGDGGDIIIKGGSCEIKFNGLHFPKDEAETGLAKHSRGDLKITKIVITGDTELDKAFPNGFTGEIKVSYK
jgi:hypothetical protein